ncbi:TPA: hypothetical protein I7148_22525 [Vibrio vulnificus]|nr:hypothetical protein [Vibrio vulnificus]HAU8254022.1 hypothetical protein [Vibrio vulnificus]
MDGYAGQVTNLRESISVNGGSGTQIYHFRINKQQFHYCPPVSTALSEGDLVKVAGEMKNGVFEVYAIKNETVGVLSKHNMRINYIGFAVSIGAVLFILSNFSKPFFGVFPYILATLFLSFGIATLYQGYRRKRAVDFLRKI